MKLTLFILLIAGSIPAISQSNTAYELQRRKINSLLDARSAKFGQFESSLSKRTGIFGLKTKKDMQRSIDILSEIVETDNYILRETKVLLDYKDFEKTEVQSKADDTAKRLKGYMTAITRLQQANSKLKADMKQQQADYKFSRTIALFAIVTLVLGIYGAVRKRF